MAGMTEDESAAAEPATRKRLRIFRAADATPVQDHMPVLGIDAGVLAGLQVLNAANPTDDPNHGAKTVVLFKEPGERGMSLTYVWFKSDYLLPRHSHDTDCLYYVRSEEKTSELQSLMRISYAVFCLKKKHTNNIHNQSPSTYITQ